MKIEFDPRKAESNPLNHEGVTFVEAKPALLDPYALTKEDAGARGSNGLYLWAWAQKVEC